jgi:hypothetical protein
MTASLPCHPAMRGAGVTSLGVLDFVAPPKMIAATVKPR